MIKIYYDSNSCWGWVNNLDELNEKACLTLDEKHGQFSSIEVFLDKSYSSKKFTSTFGTRKECDGEMTLRKYLQINDLLTEFIKIYNNEKNKN